MDVGAFMERSSGEAAPLPCTPAGGADQPVGDDAESLSLSTLLRWHFYNDGDWTLYLDTGVGVLASTDVVPMDGTGFNFLPRAGVGLTRRLTGATRLQVGLCWHHISNARIYGDLSNPSRDAPMLYAGVVFAF